MGKKCSLTNDEKFVISYLYQNKDLSTGFIAEMMNRSRDTVVKYRYYKPRVKHGYPGKVTVKKSDSSVEQDLFQKIYMEYLGETGKVQWFERDHQFIHRWIRENYWKKIWKLSRFKGVDKTDAINGIIKVLEENRLDGNDLIDLSSI